MRPEMATHTRRTVENDAQSLQRQMEKQAKPLFVIF